MRADAEPLEVVEPLAPEELAVVEDSAELQPLPASLLSLETETPYDVWRRTQDSADLNRVVKTLDGKIAYHLNRYGLGSDPLAAGQARVYAAKAIKSYDPAAGAGLATWLDRSLMQLSRFKRTRATAVRVPERMQLDSYSIARAGIDFEEEHGREPDLEELADAAGMTVKRVNAVRGGFKKMTSEAPFEGNTAGTAEPDFLSEAVEVTWEEGDKLDRKILEMKTGYGGKHPPMAPIEIAAALGLSAVQLSRRSARLGAKIEDIMENLEQ